MLLVVGDNCHVRLPASNANHKVEILNNLPDTFQTDFLATEGFWNLVDADYGIIVYQQFCLGYLLLSVTLRSIVGSIKQFNSSDRRDTALGIVFYALLTDVFVSTQQFNAGGCL